MGLRYAVVTSVNRDDQADGGAQIFARTIQEIRRRVPGCKVEVLIPDFRGNWDALNLVLATRPDVLNHNTETVAAALSAGAQRRAVRTLPGTSQTRKNCPPGSSDQDRIDAGAGRRKG